MFKVNNKDTRMRSMAFYGVFTGWLWTYFMPRSSVSIVSFEQVNAG